MMRFDKTRWQQNRKFGMPIHCRRHYKEDAQDVLVCRMDVQADRGSYSELNLHFQPKFCVGNSLKWTIEKDDIISIFHVSHS